MRLGSWPLRVGFAIPGDAETVRTAVSGGYEYDRRLLAGLPEIGVGVELIPLPRAFPTPTPAQINDTTRALAAFEGPLLIDGLGFCAMEAAAAQAVGPRSAALLHHPLYIEPGLTAAQAAAVEAREREVLASAAVIVVTSAATADDAAVRFGLDRAAIHVAPPGVDRPVEWRNPIGSQPKSSPLQLLSVGAVIPRKGYLALIDALARLESEPGTPAWRLMIAGPLDPDPAHVDEVRRRIVDLGLDDRIALLGPLEPEALSQAYRAADVFISAARLEGFGMAAAEAVAHGAPLIAASPAVWAWAPWAARVVSEEGDEALVDSLSATLRPLLHDEHARASAAAASRHGAVALPRWEDTVRAVAAALGALTGENR